MATKSILKTIEIRNKHEGNTFICALEKAEEKTPLPITLTKPVNTVPDHQIKEFLKIE